jgi:hypothetical protein
MVHGILTLLDALFQEVHICAPVGDASPGYNSEPEALIFTLSSSLFIRHY